MDDELRQYLEEMEARLGEMEARLGKKMDARLGEMDVRMGEMEVRLREHVSIECEKVETKLLTEFHKWGRTADMRTRQAITDTGLLGERMLAVEDRVSALERERRA